MIILNNPPRVSDVGSKLSTPFQGQPDRPAAVVARHRRLVLRLRLLRHGEQPEVAADPAADDDVSVGVGRRFWTQ